MEIVLAQPLQVGNGCFGLNWLLHIAIFLFGKFQKQMCGSFG